jgi:hypothetical protein
MFDLSVIVILYKKDIFESDTTLSLINAVKSVKNKKIHILIVDNSERQSVKENSFNKFEKQLSEYAFLELALNFSNENLGVIYNQAINKIESQFYCILDHDTRFDQTYFLSFFEHSRGIETGIFAPKILQDKELLYSPKRQRTIVDIFNANKIKSLSEEVSGLISSKDFFAVMSGLFIQKKVFEKGLSFNEDLKLYGIDNMLFENYSSLYDQCYILPDFLKHSLSYLDNEEIEIRIFRFEERQRSIFIISKLIRRNVIRTYTSLIISIVLNALKLRSFKPILLFRKITRK